MKHEFKTQEAVAKICLALCENCTGVISVNSVHVMTSDDNLFIVFYVF